MNIGLSDKKMIIIYYSAGEILLGITLIIVAIFFAQDYYVSHVIEKVQNTAPVVSEQ